MSRPIGIIGKSTDPHCIRLTAELQRRNREVLEIDFSSHNQLAGITMQRDRLSFAGKAVDEAKIFFLRNIPSPVPTVYVEDSKLKLYDDWHVHYMEARQHNGLVLSWLQALSDTGAQIINPPLHGFVGQLKPYHTHSLLRAGIPVPRTIITSDPIEAAQFLLEVPRAVYKPVMGGASARLVTHEIYDRLEEVKRHPVILQEYIEGDNIRVTMTANKILSVVRIPSDSVDFRESAGYVEGKTQYESWQLPAEIEQLCFKALAVSGYKFSAIDLVHTFPGTYYFLECNYAPAFATIEDTTGHKITSGIVDYLIDLDLALDSESASPQERGIFDFRLQ